MLVKVWALVLLAGAVASAETFGSISSIEEFPSLAQVESKSSLTWVQKCAGSVITNRHILSTASCFYGLDYDPTYRRIRVGTSYRGVEGQVIRVEVALIHYNFGSLGHDADIAIVRLDSYLTFGATVQQVPILGQGIELPDGLKVQHAGWGTTAEGGEVSSDDLYTLELTVNNPMSCLEKYIGTQDLTENMVCVGLGYTQGRDLDTQDVGAPLFFEDTLVGIFAFGKKADDEYPAVATSVGSYTSWIIQNAV